MQYAFALVDYHYSYIIPVIILIILYRQVSTTAPYPLTFRLTPKYTFKTGLTKLCILPSVTEHGASLRHAICTTQRIYPVFFLNKIHIKHLFLY